MEKGQSSSTSSAHNSSSGPNVSAVSRPTVARQAIEPSDQVLFGEPQASAAAAAITLRALADLIPPQQKQLLRRSAAPAPAPAEAPSAAPPQQQL